MVKAQRSDDWRLKLRKRWWHEDKDQKKRVHLRASKKNKLLFPWGWGGQVPPAIMQIT